MRKILTIIILFMLLVEGALATNEWKPLQELVNKPSYKEFERNSSDYNIRDDIEYFELRSFLFYEGKQISDKYIRFNEISTKKLSDYGRGVVSQFEQLPFLDAKETIIKHDTYSHDFYGRSRFDMKSNGFFIKKDGSLWTINEKSDLLWVFDGIDTEAELLRFLWMYDDYIFRVKYEYKELKDGYEVRKTELSYPKYDKNRNESYSEATIDIFLIKRDGSYRKEFLKKEKQYFGRVISVPSRPSYLARETKESILSMDSFVSPTKFFLIF